MIEWKGSKCCARQAMPRIYYSCPPGCRKTSHARRHGRGNRCRRILQLRLSLACYTARVSLLAYYERCHAKFVFCSSLHDITGAALDKIYLSNIGSVRELPQEELLTEVMGLSLRLDKWRESQPSSTIIHSLADFEHLSYSSPVSERLAIVLSLQYHRTSLLVHGSIIMRSLEWLTTSDGDCLSGIAGNTVASLLQRDLAAARDIHWIISHILQKKRSFLQQNASWWICNYSGMCNPLQPHRRFIKVADAVLAGQPSRYHFTSLVFGYCPAILTGVQ